MTRARSLIWLPPIVGVILAAVVYCDAYASEAGLYAGAEPGLAGLWVAGPLILLVLIQVGCVAGTYLATTDRGRAAWTAAVLAIAGVCLVGTWAMLVA